MTDVIIIGAGHNGLACAAYLARAGLAVKVLERRDVIGGAAVTQEFHPGFRNSVCAYTVSLLNPKVILDLDLAGHGLRILERPVSNFLPLQDGRTLTLHPDFEKTRAEVARFSISDADRLGDYYATLERLADVLRAFVLETPYNGGLRDLLRGARAALRLRALDTQDRHLLADLLTISAADFLGRWFEHDAVKTLFAFDGIVGTLASPYDPGTAYVLLHHAFGEVNGRKGVWGHAVGGMGAISDAIAAAARAAGAEIETGTEVAEVLLDGDRAKSKVTGVRLADGREITARAVAAGINPRLLFTRLVAADAQPEPFLRRMAQWKCKSGTFRMNVALKELPDFTCAPGTTQQPHHTSGIIMAPSLRYMDRACRDAREYGWSKSPIVEMLIPSTLDETLAPAGQHVASLFCQHFDYDLPDGQNWDDAKDAAAETVIDTVSRFAPNFRDAILGTQVLSPLDLERDFGLIGGDIFHGQLDLGQLYSLRPAAGHADYRMPVKGLYLCASGAHPGGGVTGAPGHNAAREMIRDLKGRRI